MQTFNMLVVNIVVRKVRNIMTLTFNDFVIIIHNFCLVSHKKDIDFNSATPHISEHKPIHYFDCPYLL